MPESKATTNFSLRVSLGNKVITKIAEEALMGSSTIGAVKASPQSFKASLEGMMYDQNCPTRWFPQEAKNLKYKVR